jgi:hypothetical protein
MNQRVFTLNELAHEYTLATGRPITVRLIRELVRSGQLVPVAREPSTRRFLFSNDALRRLIERDEWQSGSLA